MIRHFSVLTLAAVFALTAPAFAALKVGNAAPTFKAQASLGGKVSSFSLAAALKKGPVVLYFYPAAFTPGCTIEAHDFAAAIGKYKALHATVIGVSHDTIGTLNKFSLSECRSKFAVAADPSLKIARRYDAILKQAPKYANRTSYVIAQTGKIVYTYTNLNPDKHVANTLEALTHLKQHRKP
ncbi:MAG: peroxiredoxin [Candidatus Baltobacteraceae bacterium]